MEHWGRHGVQLPPINTITQEPWNLECKQWNKRNFASMKLVMHTLDTALLLFCAPLSTIFENRLCYNTDNIKYKARILWTVLLRSNDVRVAAAMAKALVVRHSTLAYFPPVPRHHLAQNIPEMSDNRNLRPLFQVSTAQRTSRQHQA